MPAYMMSAFLLFVCWIAALAILLIFLESWFGVAGSSRFVARRASGAYGVCSVFLVLRGPVEKAERSIRSILGQSYPFVELFLIYAEKDSWSESLAREFSKIRSHIPVRLIAMPHPVSNPHDRVRALEYAQTAAKGRWYVVVDPDVVLDRLAIEASMEFAGTGEFSALALRPGTQCASAIQQLLAPSMEYLFQMIRVVERRRERAKKMTMEASYLLINRESFEVVNRINRMPGILNEAGWSIWSYQLEGFRTFEGDGSRWIWREVGFDSWREHHPDGEQRYKPRIAGFILAATLASLVPMMGLVYGFAVPITTFFEASILALSAVSYALMAISYYLYARRLHAAAWFAPFWFLSQPIASVMTFLHIRKSGSGKDENVDPPSDSGRFGGSNRTRRGRGGQASKTFRYD